MPPFPTPSPSSAGRSLRSAPLLALLALGALWTLGLSACGPGEGAGEGRAVRAAAPAAGSSGDLVVRLGPFEHRVLLTGELRAARAVELLVPQTRSWQVDIQWLAEDGALVEEGDRLVELDNSVFATELEEKEISLEDSLAELARKEAEILSQRSEKQFQVEKARAELEKARIEADLPAELVSEKERSEKLLALERSRIELAKAESDLATFRRTSAADLETQRIAIATSQREIDAAQRAIDALTLRAPQGGIFLVGEHPQLGRRLQVGDTVHVGHPVGSLPEPSSLEVLAGLPDVDDGTVWPGQEAEVILDTYPEERYAGTVTAVEQIAQEEDPESLRRFFRTRVALDRVDPERMIPGMSVRVEVIADRREEALLVPRAAVDALAEPARAQLASGDRVEVELEVCGALDCVARGLKPGTLEAGTRLAVVRDPAGERVGAPATEVRQEPMDEALEPPVEEQAERPAEEQAEEQARLRPAGSRPGVGRPATGPGPAATGGGL